MLAETLHAELIRLQCYEGLDEAKALYEWNYQKQLLRIQADRDQGLSGEEVTQHVFSRDYLLERPLLRAITTPRRAVLLIDEIDKADEEFEAFLLELLSDFQVSIPELGTIRAQHRPVVVLTSNRARELSEALKRRCLYLWLDFPGPEKEREIIALKVPELEPQAAGAGRPLRRRPAQARPAQGAEHRRDARLGARAARPADQGAQRRRRAADAQPGAQARGGHPQGGGKGDVAGRGGDEMKGSRLRRRRVSDHATA